MPLPSPALIPIDSLTRSIALKCTVKMREGVPYPLATAILNAVEFILTHPDEFRPRPNAILDAVTVGTEIQRI
jgi:hypothetical protein